MRRQKRKAFSISILVFFLCLFLFETTFYQYENGNRVNEACQTSEQIGSPQAQLSLIDQFQLRATLNSDVLLARMERTTYTGIRIVETFFVFVILAAFVIAIQKRRQERMQCAYQTNTQNLLNVLYRQDGKKGCLFLCNY